VEAALATVAVALEVGSFTGQLTSQCSHTLQLLVAEGHHHKQIQALGLLALMGATQFLTRLLLLAVEAVARTQQESLQVEALAVVAVVEIILGQDLQTKLAVVH